MSEHKSFSEITAKDIDGTDRQFKEWSGKVVMVINVASA
jgi:glutathione peroxidase-family protein